MDFINDLANNSILIVPSNIKNKLLDYISNNKLLLDIKFMSFNDLKCGLLYDYNNEAIFSIMNKYNLSFDESSNFIKDTFYIYNYESDNKKIKYLKDIYNYLNDNNLLIKDRLFKTLLKSKNKLYVYGYDYINRFNKYLLGLAKEYIDIEIVEKDYKEYSHDIYELATMEDEVLYVAEEISKLISNNISLDKIYITGINSEYDFTIKRIFNSYGIPYFIKNESILYDTVVAKDFFNNLNSDKNKSLDYVKNKYDLENKNNSVVINKLISLINNYYWCDDLTSVKDIMIEESKRMTLPSIHMEHEILTTDIINNSFNDDEYIFLMNFNSDTFPKIKKDEDYISDNIKPKILETSKELNEINKNTLIKVIKNIKNLTITYKLTSPFNKYYPSFICNDIGDIIKVNFNTSLYSNDINKQLFTKHLDNLIKFNEDNDCLNILNNTYDIPYMTYSNKFDGLTSKDVSNNTYSYSNISTYLKCPFEFYLKNVLWIDEYKEKLSKFIGSLFHRCLEVCLNDESKDIDIEYDNYIKEHLDENDFNNHDLFFIEHVRDEIHTIIDIIKKQYKNIDERFEVWPEKRINIKTHDIGLKTNINAILKGFVDKCIVIDDDVMIIDYKTGNSDHIDRKLFEYGLNIQLPIYMYLLETTNPKLNIAGIYLQHILTGNIRKDQKKTLKEKRIDELKLDGYTLNDKTILSKFDSSYDNSEMIKGLKIIKEYNDLTKDRVYTYEEKEHIKDIIKNLIENCINDVQDSKFDITPIKILKKEEACTWCGFRDICFRKETDYRIIKLDNKKGDDEDE